MWGLDSLDHKWFTHKHLRCTEHLTSDLLHHLFPMRIDTLCQLLAQKQLSWMKLLAADAGALAACLRMSTLGAANGFGWLRPKRMLTQLMLNISSRATAFCMLLPDAALRSE